MLKNNTYPQGIESPGANKTAGGEERHEARRRYRTQFVLWLIGLIALIVASVIVHFHPEPWPIDLQTTIFVQHHTPQWAFPFLSFFSFLNNPTPSLIAAFIWLVALSLFRWFRAGLFIALGTVVADGIDGLLSTIVGRPRPHSPLIHVYMPEPFHSFPSGHTEHDMVYYGFLLYLSFTKPVRQWRYRWVLIPFQVFAVIAILAIGYSRILEGSHWVTDVLGGYLSGAVLLFALIFLYRWTTEWLARRRERKEREKGAQTLSHA